MELVRKLLDASREFLLREGMVYGTYQLLALKRLRETVTGSCLDRLDGAPKLVIVRQDNHRKILIQVPRLPEDLRSVLILHPDIQ
jgi:hypothetical protein